MLNACFYLCFHHFFLCIPFNHTHESNRINKLLQGQSVINGAVDFPLLKIMNSAIISIDFLENGLKIKKMF